MGFSPIEDNLENKPQLIWITEKIEVVQPCLSSNEETHSADETARDKRSRDRDSVAGRAADL